MNHPLPRPREGLSNAEGAIAARRAPHEPDQDSDFVAAMRRLACVPIPKFEVNETGCDELRNR